MSTSHLDSLAIVICADHVHRLVLLVLLLETFQHDIGRVGSLQHEKLVAHIISFYNLRVGVFTDLTLELREVVADSKIVLFRHHLRVDPFLQAVDMHDRATSLTAAG